MSVVPIPSPVIKTNDAAPILPPKIKPNVFLILNTFPVIEKYFDHVHTIQEQPVTIHKKLDKVLVENLNEVLAMYNRGIKLTFTDIKAIRNIMEEELGK